LPGIGKPGERSFGKSRPTLGCGGDDGGGGGGGGGGDDDTISLRISSVFRCRWLLSSNTVSMWLDQKLNSSKSHNGLIKIIYHLKDKIGLAVFCFSDADILSTNY
jgi:hypothetical protein